VDRLRFRFVEIIPNLHLFYSYLLLFLFPTSRLTDRITTKVVSSGK